MKCVFAYLKCLLALQCLVLGGCSLATASDQASFAANHPPVNIDELNPLTLSWNQVHFLVRENLLELDQLHKEHEDLYKELQGCYGLERCLTEFNLVDTSVSLDSGFSTGSLMSSLRKERERLEGSHTRLEAEMRERQRQVEYEQRRRQEQEREEQRRQHEQELQRRRQEQEQQRRRQEQEQQRRQQEQYRQQQQQYGGHSSSSSSSSQTSYGQYGHAYNQEQQRRQQQQQQQQEQQRRQQQQQQQQGASRPDQHGGQSYQRQYEYSYEYTYGGDAGGRHGGRHRDGDNESVPGRG